MANKANKTKPEVEEDVLIEEDVVVEDNEDVEEKTDKKEKTVKEPTALEQKVNDLGELVNNLLKENKELKDKVDYVSDKGRMDRFNNKEPKELVPTAGVTKINGKYVQSWTTIENVADIIDGRLHEKQVISVEYTDGTSEPMNLLNFYRNKIKVIGEVVRKFNDRENNDMETWVIKLADGEELKLTINFVN